jgi:hypothetical protein
MKKLFKITGILAVAILAAAQAHAALLASDTFTYSDGDLTTVSGGTWTIFSGTTALNVTNIAGNGWASIATTRSEDEQLTFGGTHTNDVLYAGFDLRIDTQVASTGIGYFGLFKDSSTGNLFDRVVLTNDGASVRIGIENQNGVPPIFFGLLTLGATNHIVVRYDQTGTSVATLWVNPTLETDSSVSATDLAPVQHANIIAFGLRQGANQQGNELVDNLLVGTSFADVVPEPSTVALVGAGLLGLLTMRRRRS